MRLPESCGETAAIRGMTLLMSRLRNSTDFGVCVYCLYDSPLGKEQ